MIHAGAHNQKQGEGSFGLGRHDLRRLILTVAGTIALIFGAYEIVERSWLSNADVELIHKLHILRGVGSTLIVAAFISWSLLRTSPPLLAPSREAVELTIDAKERERKRIRLCTLWFVNMRWIAIVVSATIILFCVEVAEMLPPKVLPYLLATLGGMILFNLSVWRIARIEAFARYVLQIQVVGDLVALNLLLHFSGGIENPLYILAIFQVIIAGILLTRAQCFLTAAAAGVMSALVAWGEWSQVLDHFTLSIVPHGEHGEFHVSLDGAYVTAVISIFSGALFLTAYFVTRLGEQIRSDEQKLVELASESLSTHRLLEQSLETTATAVRVLDRDLQLRWVNEQWSRWFGKLEPDPSSEPDSVPPVEQTLTDGKTRTREVCLSTDERDPSLPSDKLGNERFFRIVTAPILDKEGSVSEVVEMGQDITQQRSDQIQLVRAGQMAAIGELASHVAHEVNNPITIMSAKARLLLSRFAKELPEKVRVDLQKIVELSDRVGHIAQGLLSYARPSTGLRKPLDVTEPVTRSLDLLKQRLGSGNIRIETEFADGVPKVEANARELEQVFLNLFLNAVDAMPEGGKVSVATSFLPSREPGKPGRVTIAVRDTGIGIPVNVQERIFEPFFTTKADQKGTGLGLSICYGLIKSHGGEIAVESRPGRGTCFTVWLPSIQDSSGSAGLEAGPDNS